MDSSISYAYHKSFGTIPNQESANPKPSDPSHPITIGKGHTRSGRIVVHFGIFYNLDELTKFSHRVQYHGMNHGAHRWRVLPKKNGGFRLDWIVVTPPGTECFCTRWLIQVLLDEKVRKVIPLHRWKTTLPYLGATLTAVQKYHAGLNYRQYDPFAQVEDPTPIFGGAADCSAKVPRGLN